MTPPREFRSACCCRRYPLEHRSGCPLRNAAGVPPYRASGEFRGGAVRERDEPVPDGSSRRCCGTSICGCRVRMPGTTAATRPTGSGSSRRCAGAREHGAPADQRRRSEQRNCWRTRSCCAGAATPCSGCEPDSCRNALQGAGLSLLVAMKSHPGSAPHARGTRIADRSGLHRRRVSPACAGNTSSASSPSDHAPGQPRMRGEHVVG